MDPFIQLLVNSSNEGMHYLVVKVVMMMLTWAQTAIPDVSHYEIISTAMILYCVGSFMASRLLEYLMQNAGHANQQIFKNDFEIKLLKGNTVVLLFSVFIITIIWYYPHLYIHHPNAVGLVCIESKTYTISVQPN